MKNLVRGMGNEIYFNNKTIAMLSTLITELNKDRDFLSNYDIFDVSKTSYFLLQSLELNCHACMSLFVCYSISKRGTHIYSLSCITYI